jgi:hypothetical protein
MGLHALLGCSSYRLGRSVDERGHLVPSGQEIRPFVLRIAKIWSSVSKSRRDFEGRPDTGFLGKNFTRIFNVFWNYCLKGFIGTLILLVAQPILTIANLLVTIALVLTSVVYIPIASFAVLCFNVCIYDTQHAKFGIKKLPIFSELLGRIFVCGIGQILLGIFLSFLLWPVLSFIVVVAAAIRWTMRRCWDAFMFLFVILARGRVPATENFAARRISGPGMSRGYFNQITPEVAISALQITLEHLELTAFKQQALEQIMLPSRTLSAFLRSFLTPLGLDYATSSNAVERLRKEASEIEKRLEMAIDERKKELPSTWIGYGHNIK